MWWVIGVTDTEHSVPARHYFKPFTCSFNPFNKYNYYQSYFIDEEAEAQQRTSTTYSKSPSLQRCWQVRVCFSTIHKSHDWDSVRMSTDGWVKKTMWYVYTKEYYSALKNIEILSLAAMWMEPELSCLTGARNRKTSTTCSHSYVEAKNVDRRRE